MKFFLISDNVDTQMGMRLAGIEGVVVSTKEEVISVLNKTIDDEQIAVVLITEKLVELCKERIYEIKLNLPKPLIVGIPDRHGNSGISKSIDSYVSEAIGLKL